ncbi:7SK snRNA methylphosphate capping enzyme [Anguilla anguilla]|uniref:7SK snRNA methylphosphate capping enzyme n=1 Tax=Anguilla anguilla TaxID=7936 RepID=UPI0015A8AE0F|nr:7SK snRNA methylphosphate capping enzyme [Anguilla anguilla]XP_035265595.1 7SK snRNA methylphosphate capping enzyme [Anguilla anguilla]
MSFQCTVDYEFREHAYRKINKTSLLSKSRKWHSRLTVSSRISLRSTEWKMIEMSVDKETVLAGDGRVDPMTHQQPQQLTECTGSCTNAPKSLVATSGSLEDGTSCTVAAFSGSVVLTEQLTNESNSSGGCSRTESMGLGPRNHFRPKNGLQQPQQQQKMNKRRYSMNVGFKHPGFSKRRRRANSESDPVLPTNFLLGGNIFDPLNLNSLLDDEVNRALNAETPKSSPLPAKSRDPVEILIPKDITDPLNLNSAGGNSGILVSPLKSGGRKRHRNRHHGGGGGMATAQLDLSLSERGKPAEGCVAAAGGASLQSLPASRGAAASVVPEAPKEGAVLHLTPVPESPRPYELNTSINCRDEVVQPILPRSQSHAVTSSTVQSQAQGSANSVSVSSSATHQLPSSRHRKRRRTSSKSDSSITPTQPAKKGSVERGRGPGSGKRPQTFHTPVGGGRAGSLPASGKSGHQQLRNRRKQQKFQYGNYNKYYGYRNLGLSEDSRLRVLKPEWFRGKAVLDLGCNTGHVTLTIATNWRPARILGLDIDGGLIHAARQNIRHYLSELQAQEARRTAVGWQAEEGTGVKTQEGGLKERKKHRIQEQKAKVTEKGGNKMEDKQEAGQKQEEVTPMDTSGPTEKRGTGKGGKAGKVGLTERVVASREPLGGPVSIGRPFPISLRICRGPIAAPPLLRTIPGDFPANVSFVKGNYVLESDALLHTQQPEYDVILCLSMTKWVHLNWGDGGVQRLFKRAFRHLQPGGIFILEPQPWASYGKRKRLTETTYKNYYNIRFKPDRFTSYLTSEVGFSSYELLGTPKSSSRGFQRPIYLFHKGPSCSRK